MSDNPKYEYAAAGIAEHLAKTQVAQAKAASGQILASLAIAAALDRLADAMSKPCGCSTIRSASSAIVIEAEDMTA